MLRVMNQHRQLLLQVPILGILFLVLVGGLAFFYSQLVATDIVFESDCADDYSVEMSPNQVSELMGIPFVELTWLPEDVDLIPQVTPYTLYHVDSSGDYTCVLRITYSTSQVRDVVDIRVFTATTNTVFDTWNCSYDEALKQSICFGEVGISNSYSRISMFTIYAPEIATQIANGIIIRNRE